MRRTALIVFSIAVSLVASTAAHGAAKVDPNTEVVCPGGELQPFKWGVLKGPRNAENDKTGSAWLLRKFIREKYLEFMPTKHWFEVGQFRTKHTRFIQYANGDIDGLTAITFAQRVGKKRWSYEHSGHGFDCDPRLLTSARRAAVPWSPIAESLPTDPASKTVRIRVTEEDCNSGQDASRRVTVDGIEYSASEVRIRIDVRPSPGVSTCPSNPATYFDVPLAEPIGDRSIVDISGVWPIVRASSKQLMSVRGGANPIEELLFDKSDADFCRDGGPFLYGMEPSSSQQKRWYKRAIDVCPKSMLWF